MRRFVLIFVLFAASTLCGFAQQTLPEPQLKQVFELKNPDLNVSPYTGVTRQHWKEAALYMLEGAFGYIKTLDDPMKFPKQPGISYPKDDNQIPTEKLEGLCRTLFVAAPLLKDNPELTIHGIKVADYYRHQILNLVNPDSPSYIRRREPDGGPGQNLVEFGALAISMSMIPEVVWAPLSKEQKDALAATMLSYGDGPTIDSNWRFFNIFILSFFKEQGYPINEKLLVEYLDKTLTHYRGEGWYNDSPAYDYYSMWAFQMYGLLWSEYYGNKYYPDHAKKFMQHFSDLKYNYPYLFSRNGKMIMWGRSISYRYASVTPFPLMGFENAAGTNWGWMRRIASSTLMQFFTHPELMKDGVPTLGFYGAFEPAVQMYSCRGSVYWGGKVFLGLFVPADSPFWTAIENEGPWENEMKKGNVYNKFQPSINMLITDYPNSGASEVRAWCNATVASDWQKFRSSENYNRLSYNSEFPWQADGNNGEVAMNYVIRNAKNEWEAWRLYTFKSYNDGVYCRDVVLETNENIKMNLADITLPNGIFRVDRNSSSVPISMRLGHYALPELKGEIKTKVQKVRGFDVTIIDNGEYQLAMVPVLGWSATEVVSATGLHPVSNRSKVIVATGEFDPKVNSNRIYATLMLWKKSGEKWSNKELMPLKRISPSSDGSAIDILFVDGTAKHVVF